MALHFQISKDKIPILWGFQRLRWLFLPFDCQSRVEESKGEETGKPLFQIIQETVSRFVRKKNYRVSIAAPYLPKAIKDNYKSLKAYFTRFDWDCLVRVSENTGIYKAELVRQAVDEYLSESS